MSRPAASLVLVLLLGAPTCAAAQAPGEDAAADDHRLVLVRAVHPRIAYRGLPAKDNPVHVEATVFPGRVFHAALDELGEAMVGDDALAQTLPVAIGNGPATMATVGSSALPLDASTGGATMRVPLGAGATVSGSLGGLGRGLGDRVTGALRVMPIGAGP